MRFFRAIRSYVRKLRFRRNAWLYLVSTALAGISLGAFRLLLNFYVDSLGYTESLMGGLQMVSSVAALVGALPAGYLTDRLGRKRALLLSTAVAAGSVAGLTVWRNLPGLYVMNALLGLAQSLSWVTVGPFLMENSREEERTYLFSFHQGAQTIAASAGSWGGGQLPGWLGNALGASGTSSTAYATAIGAIAAASLLGLLPLALLKRQPALQQRGEASLSPFRYAYRHPVILGKLIGPQLIISLGAGLLMPFMNIFFRNVHHRPDGEIGTIMAWGSLAMGIGLLIAPPLADRWGKIRVVVVTQALSIPFLIMLGFAPWFWLSAAAYLIRAALMNMSGPVYNTFIMEKAESRARATVASLASMSWNIGWTLSPPVSGWIQEQWGFSPVFLGTISTYIVGIYLTWWFFGRAPAPAEATSEPNLVADPHPSGEHDTHGERGK